MREGKNVTFLMPSGPDHREKRQGTTLFLIAITCLIGCGREEGRKPKPVMDYPTAATIREWDDASLATTLWERADELYREKGLDGLNEVEKTMLAVMVFDGEVNNGGFGQWLAQTPVEIMEITTPSLQRVGADRMSAFVNKVLKSAGGVQLFDEGKRDNLMRNIGDELDRDLMAKNVPFLELEPGFLDSVYRYARNNWQTVRRP